MYNLDVENFKTISPTRYLRFLQISATMVQVLKILIGENYEIT